MSIESRFSPEILQSHDGDGLKSFESSNRKTLISSSPTAFRAGWRPNSSAGSARSSSRWSVTSRSRSGGCSPTSISREAKKTEFRSLHDCFIRELKDGARPIDGAADILVSPCDAIVGACGAIDGTELYQAKGFPYTLQDLLCDPDLVEAHRNGRYVTLRLTSSMYHRFHAPHDGRIDRVIYVSGDTWNVNPIALKRIERLFCKNERAVLPDDACGGRPDRDAGRCRRDPRRQHSPALSRWAVEPRLPRTQRHRLRRQVRKGDELGWFQHGSTIIVFAPDGFSLLRQCPRRRDHPHGRAAVAAGER